MPHGRLVPSFSHRRNWLPTYHLGSKRERSFIALPPTPRRNHGGNADPAHFRRFTRPGAGPTRSVSESRLGSYKKSPGPSGFSFSSKVPFLASAIFFRSADLTVGRRARRCALQCQISYEKHPLSLSGAPPCVCKEGPIWDSRVFYTFETSK